MSPSQLRYLVTGILLLTGTFLSLLLITPSGSVDQWKGQVAEPAASGIHAE